MSKKNNLSPLVSIIIPCYNYGQYVMEAIDSCLQSTYKNIEIIIVNDCSTDSYTNSVLSSMKKPKTIVINHPINRGLSAARNTGIEAAKGVYFLPLDADDMIDPDFIAKTLSILENNTKIGFVSTGIRYFGLKNKIHIPSQYNFYKLLFANQCVVTSLVRRKCWEDVGGYNVKMKDGYEDWDFWISIGKKGWYGYRIKDVLFYYRKHGISMIDAAKKKHQELIMQIRQNHAELYRPENLVQIKKIWVTNQPRTKYPKSRKKLSSYHKKK